MFVYILPPKGVFYSQRKVNALRISVNWIKLFQFIPLTKGSTQVKKKKKND